MFQFSPLNEFEGVPVKIKRRPYQRTINVRLDHGGFIRVTCGRQVKDREIKRFLVDVSQWLKTAWNELAEKRKHFPVCRFFEGERFPFLGSKVPLSFANTNCKRLTFTLSDGKLICRWPSSTEPPGDEELARAVYRFYRNEAKKFLSSRAVVFSQQMDLHPERLSFRLQRSRWGSCSSTGTVSLNIKLMAFPAAVVDYVVVHELAHLRFPHHAKAFWQLVAEHCPEYRVHRRWLKEHGIWLAGSLPF